eukprot:11203041-Lingulodinium_polyedra.AAC.1
MAQGDGRSANAARATATILLSAARGSQHSQTASAHLAMGASRAAKAGSALPRMEPSARTRA